MADLMRVSSGVPGLDAMLGGGYIPQSAILVRGAPGTGKTTFGLQFVLDGARQGQAGLFVTFEEFPQSLYRDAASLGWDLAEVEASGALHLLFTSPEVLLTSLATPDSNLLRRIQQGGVQRVVVDSLSHFTRAVRDDHARRRAYHQVISAFRREGITAVYLDEEGRADYTRQERGGLSFIADTLIMLRYLEIDSAIQRALLVLKMRGSAHNTSIHRYTIGPGGSVVGEPLTGLSGLLSGLVERHLISTVR